MTKYHLDRANATRLAAELIGHNIPFSVQFIDKQVVIASDDWRFEQFVDLFTESIEKVKR